MHFLQMQQSLPGSPVPGCNNDGGSMNEKTNIIEYKCPCCNAGLVFGSHVQQLTCEYCDNTFDLDTVLAYNESESKQSDDDFTWDTEPMAEWSESEITALNAFQCPACGGEILTDDTTAATFCPFCDNPSIMPTRLSGSLKPDAVLPFQKSKDDAKEAFLKLCKGKKLLPKNFTAEQRLEKITGMYVPFWLYDCEANINGSYKATRIHRWSDTKYHYTRTEHFLLTRKGHAAFSGIPMDGSSKMDDAFMESIEPFDYTQMVPFEMPYLTGYLADKYDIPSDNGKDRIRQRVEQSMQDKIQSTLAGYATVVPSNRQIQVHHSKEKYVLLPVWMLNTQYNGKIYTFAMNGQTGKMTGTLPICRKQALSWFVKICGGVTLLVHLLQMML